MFLRLVLVLMLVGLAGSALAGPGHDHSHQAKATAQAKVTTMNAEVGKPAPNFTLTDTEGKEHTLSEYVKAGNIVVLEWFNPDCPFVKKHHVTFGSMGATQQAFVEENVVWLAINSGAPGKQGKQTRTRGQRLRSRRHDGQRGSNASSGLGSGQGSG